MANIKPPQKTAKVSRNTVNNSTFAAPAPKVSRQKPGKVLSEAERAAFLAARPDLKPKPTT